MERAFSDTCMCVSIRIHVLVFAANSTLKCRSISRQPSPINPLRSGPEPRTRERAFPGAEAVAVTSCRLLPVSFEVQDAGHVPFRVKE